MRNPFKRRVKTAVTIRRPLPDEDALALVKAGVLKPYEAPSAVLRDMVRKQYDSQ